MQTWELKKKFCCPERSTALQNRCFGLKLRMEQMRGEARPRPGAQWDTVTGPLALRGSMCTLNIRSCTFHFQTLSLQNVLLSKARLQKQGCEDLEANSWKKALWQPWSQRQMSTGREMTWTGRRVSWAELVSPPGRAKLPAQPMVQFEDLIVGKVVAFYLLLCVT